VTALRRADPPSKGCYRLCKNDYETEEEARAQQKAVEPLMNDDDIMSTSGRTLRKVSIYSAVNVHLFLTSSCRMN
jgi:hypothetical protein